MSFKIGDRVREIATGDEGVILEENFETCSYYVLVRWTTGLCSGMDVAICIELIELVEPAIFTQRDLQILENELRKLIYEHEISMETEKYIANTYWEICDKNDKETEEMFEHFSSAYKDYKHHKAKLNQLAALQAKIKRAKNGA